MTFYMAPVTNVIVSTDPLTLWIQAGATLAAVAAAIIALVVSALDRRNSRQIAATDRAEARKVVEQDRVQALRHSQLLFEQQALLTLLENGRHGGSTDDLKRADLGAEAAALIGFIGKDRLPMNWANRVGVKTRDDLVKLMNTETHAAFQRDAIEVQLALTDVTDEINELMGRKPTQG